MSANLFASIHIAGRKSARVRVILAFPSINEDRAPIAIYLIIRVSMEQTIPVLASGS
jgi:hypothetical protein